MEGDTIITQDLFVYDLIGEDANGKIIGRHRSTGIGRPRFWDRARYYGEEKRLAAAHRRRRSRERELKRAGHENAGTRIGLSRRRRHRRHRLGLHLSAVVGREKGREPPRLHRQAGAGRGPADAKRTSARAASRSKDR